MAKRRISDLHGVLLKKGNDVIGRADWLSASELKEYKICDVGSPVYYVNLEDHKIDNYVVKAIYADTHYVAQKGTHNNFIPRFTNKFPEDFKSFGEPCRADGTHVGLWYTDLIDASEALSRISKGDAFISLKRGDKLYIYHWYTDNIYEHTVIATRKNGNEFIITLDNDRKIRMGESCYENSTGPNKDTRFGMTDKNAYIKSYFYCINATIYVNKADADKVIQKKEAARKSRELKLKSKVGQQLVLKDNKGNILHFGDKVVYYGPFGMSYGVILNEGKKKITVFDEERCKKIRAWMWDTYNKNKGKPGYTTPPVENSSDGCYSINCDAILLIK